MTRTIHALLMAGVVVAGGAAAAARADLSGHWEGVLQAPDRLLDFQIDVARGTGGAYAGTISLPGEGLHGLPLKAVALDGASVSFHARSDQTFTGTLSADGKSITGEFSMQGGSAPFRLSRVGDAKIEAPPTSPRISERLAGTWNASVPTRQGGVSVVLKLSNTAEGRSTGTLINLNDGGIELPLAIEETASGVTLRTTPIESVFSGTLSADGMILDGTYRQGPQSMPVTIRTAQN